jgi:protein BUR2
LFIATKIEEHSRKLRDLVIACCRVAQKNHNLIVDEQTKDFWRWKDTIAQNEDLVLELLCFDLTIESPHVLFFQLIKRYEVSQNKALRSSAWSFLNDSSLSVLCLVFPSRAIAVLALLYGACKEGPVQLPDDEDGRPWWEVEGVSRAQINRAIALMAEFYDKFRAGNSTEFVGCLTDEKIEDTRLKRAQTPDTPDSTRQLSAYANMNDGDIVATLVVKGGNPGSPRKRRTLAPDGMELDQEERSQGIRVKRIKSVEPPPSETHSSSAKKNGNGELHDSGSGSEEGEI